MVWIKYIIGNILAVHAHIVDDQSQEVIKYSLIQLSTVATDNGISSCKVFVMWLVLLARECISNSYEELWWVFVGFVDLHSN